MKRFITTVTQRGQVTVPVQVRRALGLKPRDKVSFTIQDGRVVLAPAPFTLESAYGSVKPSRKPEDFEAISSEAKKAKVEKTLGKLARR